MVVGAGQQTSTTEISSSAHQQTGDDGADDPDALAQMTMIKAGYSGCTDTSGQRWYHHTWLTGIGVLADKVAFANASGQC